MRGLTGVAVVVAASVHVAGVAAAAGLSSTSPRFAAGSAAVTACGDLSLASARYSVTEGAITSLTVVGVPAGCVGSRLSATLTSDGTAVASAAEATVAATSVTFPSLSATPPADTVTDVRLVAIGP